MPGDEDGRYICVNIARGTTDPEIDSVTWTNFVNNMAPLALVANLATCISCIFGDQVTQLGSKFGHQVAPFALFAKLATRLHHCIATLS